MARLTHREGEAITEEDRLRAEAYLPEIQSIEPFLRKTLESLPDFEHDLIVMAYGFRGEGFSYRTNTSFHAYSEREFAERLSKARAMFALRLREQLEKVEQSPSKDRILGLLRGEE